MNSDPNLYRVEDLIKSGKLEIGDGYRAKNSELSKFGIPFARAGNINDGFKFDGADHFPESELHRVGSKVSQPGDVVFTSKGTVGRFALVEESSPRFVYSPQLCYWRTLDTSVISPEYVYYWMKSREFLHQISYLKGQTDMADYVSLRDQRRMSLTIPSLPQQHEIVSCLKPLDDRIVLLRETNKTLEAIAQAIFKSWFVDFDPVRAKMEGRQPEGMDEETADLFPDSFEESGIGPAPESWSVKTIGDVIQTEGGGTPSTKNAEYWEPGVINWTSPRDLSGALSPILLDTERRISQAGLARISSGLLPVGTLLMSSRAPIGYLALTQIPVAINQGYIAILPNGQLPPRFMYFWCKLNMETVRNHANGSTFMEISRRSFRIIPLLVPCAAVIDRFLEMTHPLFDRIVENERQAQTLTSLRDTLLPRLISGRLRLPETQALATEACI